MGGTSNGNNQLATRKKNRKRKKRTATGGTKENKPTHHTHTHTEYCAGNTDTDYRNGTSFTTDYAKAQFYCQEIFLYRLPR